METAVLLTPSAATLVAILTALDNGPRPATGIRFDIEPTVGSVVMQRACEPRADDDIVCDEARVFLSPAAGGRLAHSTLDTRAAADGQPRFLFLP